MNSRVELHFSTFLKTNYIHSFYIGDNVILESKCCPGYCVLKAIFEFLIDYAKSNITIYHCFSALIGRSSFINRYLMKDSETFSSLSNPSSNFGKSLGRSCYLEFIPLSERVCEESHFWPAIEGNKATADETLLLGILHGDALSFKGEMYDQILPFVSCIVVFWTCEDWKILKKLKKQLSTLLIGANECRDVILYPDSTMVENIKEENLLFKIPLVEVNPPGSVDILNGTKLRRIMSDAFTPNLSKIQEKTKLIRRFQEPEPAWTVESKDILAIIEEHSLKKVILALEDAENELGLQILVGFHAILKLPEQKRRVALYHLNFELDFMSRSSTEEIRKKIKELRSLPVVSEGQKSQIKVHVEDYKLNLLTLQDLIYETGLHLKSNGSEADQNEFCQIVAEMFLSDISLNIEKSFDASFLRMFQKVLENLPNDLRVFVVSIVGMKDTGKSTLLHRLYGGCKNISEFSCGKGILCKLLRVDESIRQNYECDVFLLLDSEGISAPENHGDSTAQKKDWELLTFLLKMSDITILNVMADEEIDKLLPVFESSLLSILTNENDDMAAILPPDVIVARQIQDNEHTDASKINEKLLNSFQSIWNTSRNELSLGISSNGSLRNVRIQASILEGNFAADIQPLAAPSYHESVTKLRQKIENKCIESRSDKPRFGLQEWFYKAMGFYDGTLQQELQLIQKPQLSAFETNKVITLQERTLEVKHAISKAMWVHEERIHNEWFDITLGEIFGGDFKPGFDKQLELQLNKIANEFLKIPDTCDSQLQRGEIRSAIRVGSVNSSACDECQEAFAMREELFANLEVADEPKSFLAVEEVESLSNQIRFQIYNRFLSTTLAKCIQTGKSEQFGNLVKNLQDNGEGPLEIYKMLQRQISTLRFIPNAQELLHAELESVYENLPQVIVGSDPFQRKDFKLENLEVFKQSPFYSESTYVTSAGNNRLNWEQSTWIKIQFKDGLEAFLREFGLGQNYQWGMGFRLRARIEEVLEVLGEMMGRSRRDFQIDFVHKIHSMGVKSFFKLVGEQQSIWLGERDPMQQLEKAKDDFIQNPGDYFIPYDL